MWLTLFSVVSGVFWGGLAFALVATLANVPALLTLRFLFLFLVFGGTVGWLTGLALRRLSRPGMLATGVMSGVTLMVTIYLFGVLVSATTELGALHARYSRPSLADVLGHPVWWMILLCQTGVILMLWPLAFLNHRLFFSIRGISGSAEEPAGAQFSGLGLSK